MTDTALKHLPESSMCKNGIFVLKHIVALIVIISVTSLFDRAILSFPPSVLIGKALANSNPPLAGQLARLSVMRMLDRSTLRLNSLLERLISSGLRFRLPETKLNVSQRKLRN